MTSIAESSLVISSDSPKVLFLIKCQDYSLPILDTENSIVLINVEIYSDSLAVFTTLVNKQIHRFWLKVLRTLCETLVFCFKVSLSKANMLQTHAWKKAVCGLFWVTLGGPIVSPSP